MSLKEFKNKVSSDYIEHRNNFKDNYTWIENYCKKKYGKKNYLDWLAERLNLIEVNRVELINLVSIDYIKSHSLGFVVRPTLKDATNLLRNLLIDRTIEFNYTKNENRAVLELLKQIRDNLTHQGKYEIDRNQLERNVHIIKNASIISGRIVELIDEME